MCDARSRIDVSKSNRDEIGLCKSLRSDNDEVLIEITSEALERRVTSFDVEL